ncbi:MAG: helix-turn-helix transcriptional regulator [Bacteroidales bacterium]|nr:helix-turn-helix transcriptional regulator [Bacteroidales bacterium]
MANLSIIRNICKVRNISLTELSTKIEMTPHALQRMFKTNSTKVDTLEKIADVLEVSPDIFFRPPSSYILLGDRLIKTLSKRYNKFTDKLSFFKDFYVWKSLNLIFYGFKPNLFEWETQAIGEIDIKKSDQYFSLTELDKEAILIPYSKWPEKWKAEFLKTDLIEKFYYAILESNFLNIHDYLGERMFEDNQELMNAYDNWRLKKFPHLLEKTKT